MNTAGTRYSPPWIFGITNIPYGVAGTYCGVAMPFILRKHGVPIEQIAALGALCLLPAAYQLFWAPILDLGIRRRSWLILCSITGAICLAATLLMKLPEQLMEYQILMVIGQALVGLVASCNGALVSTTVDPAARGRAAGWVNAANLGAAMLGGGVVLSLFNTSSPLITAAALAAMIILPSFAALTIKEAPPLKEPIIQHVGNMGREVWKAVRARKGWTGLLFCISPVGTVALTNLFSGLGNEFQVSNQLIEWINGYGGGFITAGGALASGYLLDKCDNRKFYLLSGILSFICCMIMAFAPHTPVTYVAGTLFYFLIAGLAYASFSAVVYEIVGTAGSTASTLYSVFPAAGNQAIAYVLFFDGKAHQAWGTRGLFLCDGLLNLAGVGILLLLLKVVFAERKKTQPAIATSATSGAALVQDAPILIDASVPASETELVAVKLPSVSPGMESPVVPVPSVATGQGAAK
jgi:MFS transporter, PAT family, beta-lactamase induction signal transducer AmpG